jgi:hypothetical protein
MRVYKNKRYCSFQQHNNQPKTNTTKQQLQLRTATATTNCYLNHQLLLQLPTAASITNCYFNHQLLLQPPTATSTTNCYFNHQLLLQPPTATSTTNYQLQPHTLTTSTATHWYYCLHHQNYYCHYELLNTRGSAAPDSMQGLTSRLFRCHRVVLRFRSNFTKVSQRIE